MIYKTSYYQRLLACCKNGTIVLSRKNFNKGFDTISKTVVYIMNAFKEIARCCFSKKSFAVDLPRRNWFMNYAGFVQVDLPLNAIFKLETRS